MTQITAQEINSLRQQTGAGMMDCRKALMESGGNIEKAIDLLRKKGQKVAELRGGREVNEGIILTGITGTRGVLFRLSCETDFVAKNEGFISFGKQILATALQSTATTKEALVAEKIEGVSIADKINEQVAKIGEKIALSDFTVSEAQGLVDYVHGGYRIGVMVAFNKSLNAEQKIALKDIAMQVAAMNPLSVDEQTLPEDLLAREKSVIQEQLRSDPKMAGKPADMLEKILQGKMKAFFKERTLLAQAFIKNDAQDVAAYLKSIDPELKVLSFIRVAL